MVTNTPKSTARLVVLLLLLLIGLSPVQARDVQQDFDIIKTFFPTADRLGPLQGKPPSAEVFNDDRLLGYVFYTLDIKKIPAYSGKPINTLIGINLKGEIVGLKIVHHEEPILVVGISDADLQRFIGQYVGKRVNTKIKIGGRDRDGYKAIDTITGATITVMVLNVTINAAVHEVAKARGLIAEDGKVQVIKPEPIWVTVWKGRIFEIVLLSLGLGVLMLILILQDWLAKHPNLLGYVRTGFLIYTVLFIGLYAMAQLSIVNVLTFVNSFIHGFSWQNFLIDPMMFILWGFVAMTILLWGRGVYCGWLCPFGALQELLFRISELLRLPAFEFPEVVHERLWAIKYIILLALFGLSLQSMTLAEQFAEVEPFKTVVTLRFAREWGFVLYALALLIISMFNRKFYCRYLCPLGAALTYPSKFRIFDWLRRYKECGRPCQICRQECEVRAIRSTGEINANECHYCLDCQVTYWNDQKCPPLVEKRKKREKAIRIATMKSGKD